MNSRILVKNIRSICQQKGVSIMHMEEELGFSPGLISRWSKTKTSPSFDKIVDIVNYLGVSFEDLLLDEEESSFEYGEEASSDRYSKFSSQSYKTKNGDVDKEHFYKKLAELTEQKKIYWENGGGDTVPYDFPIEKAVNVREYSRHEWYCYKIRNGYFVLVVQYNQHTRRLHTALYVAADPLMEPVKEKTENSKWFEVILKYADGKFYEQISRDKADDLVDDFLNMDFSKVAGM